ncbi:MAG: hypothetical protein NTW21_11215 [Verrucomicrobia bacterium]|nr:hypothetical protein [Verrucomicrobiota bacterium]
MHANRVVPNGAADKKAPPAPTITGHWSKSDPGEVPELVLQTARSLREKYLEDPTRPGYHFATVDGIAYPADPNGAFFANGRYHLMYFLTGNVMVLNKLNPHPLCWHLTNRSSCGCSSTSP